MDESFSLQRAESSWPDLLIGRLPLADGVRTVSTLDQHPLAYFVLLGLMLRAAGQSEFALRFPAVMAATLAVPAIWVLAQRLRRNMALPASAPFWAALLMAFSPFYLWFGREVRMYAQVALLALLSTYLLLRWADASGHHQRRSALVGYALMLLALLASHYFALMVVPVQAVLVFQSLARTTRRKASLVAAALTLSAAAPGLIALWLLARDAGAGANWTSVSPRILVPDLLNAFSLGLSVDIARVWPIDLGFAAVALLGVAYGLRWMRRTPRRRGWLLPALVMGPPAVLLVINAIRPAYMTARHMSMISGFFLLLVAGGLAWLWQARRWAGAAVAACLVAAMTYSTINYHVSPVYDNGDLAGMGEYLRERIQPGDALLTQPVPWGRLYRYYLPIDTIERGQRTGAETLWRSLPMLGLSDQEAIQAVLALSQHQRRIWLAQSDRTGAVEEWLLDHAFRADERAFAGSRSGLKLVLLQPASPIAAVATRPPAHVVEAAFGGQVRLVGYDMGQPLVAGGMLPVTLHWQAPVTITRHYKYILRLVAHQAGGAEQVIATTETEPYNGLLPTTTWPAGATIVEYTGVPSPQSTLSGETRLTLQVYDAESLAKLPLTAVAGAGLRTDEYTLALPFAP